MNFETKSCFNNISVCLELKLPFDHSLKTAFKITKNTKSQFSLYPSFCRVHFTKQAIRYKGPLIWNDIPFNL